jgi:methionyl-tRNA formyltransferase
VVTSFKAKKNPIKSYSFENQLLLFDWNEIRGFGLPNEYDLGLVVSFGHLIPATIIDLFPTGMLNLHASLLPKFRGASPIIYALRTGEEKTGVSIMKIEPGHFDTGSILAQKEYPISKDVMMPELHDKLGEIGASLLVECVLNYEECSRKSIAQDESLVSYGEYFVFDPFHAYLLSKNILAPKIDNEFARIRWDSMDSLNIYNLHRSLYSFKHITTSFRNESVKIVELKYDHSQNPAEQKPSGFIKYCWKNKSLLVQCIDNKFIEIFKLSVGKKKVMSALDFHNGYLKCSESERFFI